MRLECAADPVLRTGQYYENNLRTIFSTSSMEILVVLFAIPAMHSGPPRPPGGQFGGSEGEQYAAKIGPQPVDGSSQRGKP